MTRAKLQTLVPKSSQARMLASIMHCMPCLVEASLQQCSSGCQCAPSLSALSHRPCSVGMPSCTSSCLMQCLQSASSQPVRTPSHLHPKCLPQSMQFYCSATTACLLARPPSTCFSSCSSPPGSSTRPCATAVHRLYHSPERFLSPPTAHFNNKHLTLLSNAHVALATAHPDHMTSAHGLHCCMTVRT